MVTVSVMTPPWWVLPDTSVPNPGSRHLSGVIHATRAGCRGRVDGFEVSVTIDKKEDDMSESNQPSVELKALDRLVGTWAVTGGAEEACDTSGCPAGSS